MCQQILHRRRYSAVFLTLVICLVGVEWSPTFAQEATDDNQAGESVRFRRRAVDCPKPGEPGGQQAPIAELRIDIATQGDLMPLDCAENLFDARPVQPSRGWNSVEFNWEATNFAHRPLYFEQTPLEVYGQTLSHPVVQPIASGAHFFGSILILPYKMGVDRPHDDIYTLGLYRPGDPAPCVKQTLPLEWDAAIFQGITVAGLVFLIP